MWHTDIRWVEIVLRSVIVYAFLLILLRLTGKRQVGQLAPFDLVLLLVLSNAVQNAMTGGDNSLPGGLLAAGTLVLVNHVIGLATYYSKPLESLIEGRPIIIIHDGHIDRRALRRVKMTMHELDSALRSQGHAGPEDVRFALLENNGHLTVICKNGNHGMR